MTKHLTTALRAREGGAITSSSGIVAEIKAKLPVTDIVGETVALKRAGTIQKGLCPFHAEKTPSFIVTPERETWHCFGCGEHGDIFTFVMRRDGLDFREALSRLAERAGVELSARTAGEDRAVDGCARRSRRRSRGTRGAAQAARPSGARLSRGARPQRGDPGSLRHRLCAEHVEALSKRLRSKGSAMPS